MKNLKIYLFLAVMGIFAISITSCTKEADTVSFEEEVDVQLRDGCRGARFSVLGSAWDESTQTACVGSEVEVIATGLCEPITWKVLGGSHQVYGDGVIIQTSTSPAFYSVRATGCDGCSIQLLFRTINSGRCFTSTVGLPCNGTLSDPGSECYCLRFPFAPECTQL